MSYVVHLVEQIQHNLSFLVENGHMSQQDANLVISRLPAKAPPLNVAVATIAPVPAHVPRPIPAPPVSSPKTVKARAIWAYNENGQDPEDLSFHAGDIIEIVEETNADWWMGRINGKQGLLPSNHVEKLPNSTPGPVRAIMAPPPQYNQPSATAPATERKPYKAFGAAYHGADKPPPNGSGAVNSVGLQEAPGQDKKKGKYGALGNTMAHSAAGGVGFGAGAAIGGGLVRAIF